jgi:cytochrome oxidase assembly protein ShyY1
MLTTILVAWLLVTLVCLVGLAAFLVLDEWQVRRREAPTQTLVPVSRVEVEMVA